MLQLLSDPASVEHGATAAAINREAKPGGTADTVAKLLKEMRADRLIEYRETPIDGRTKPLFITQQGRDYLATATEKALFPEIGQRQDWSARESAADLLRKLPEFRDSGEDRIQEVSRELAEAMSRTTKPSAIARPAH